MVSFNIPLSACVVVVLLFITGCVSVSSEIVGSDTDHVWVRKPFIGDGSADDLAAEYCARSNRNAVFESELTISDAKRIAVYKCQ